MKFILVVTDTKRKNSIFVSDQLQALSIAEVIENVRNGLFDNIYIVKRKSGSYVKTMPSVPKEEEFEMISLSSYKFFSILQNFNISRLPLPIRMCVDEYTRSNTDKKYIEPVGSYKASITRIKEKILKNKENIKNAAEYFSVDDNLLGAILIDEIARVVAFESVLDAIGGDLLGRNTSAGIAQVKLNTAHGIIRKDLYNPDKTNKKLLQKLDVKVRKELYDYVKKPKHSIYFAAAIIRSFIDDWKSEIELSDRLEILATLYHLPYKKPHSNPKSNERGNQIADEFYKHASKWLNE